MTEKDIAELLAKEAEAAEINEDEEESRQYRRPPPPSQASQVYSVRIPVERLEQLRAFAVKLGLRPTTLMRKWVLERLDEETGARATFENPQLGQITVVIDRATDVHINADYLAHRIGDDIMNRIRRTDADRA